MHKIYAFIIQHKELIKKFLPVHFLKKLHSSLIRAKIRRFHAGPIQTEAYRSMPFGVNLIGDIQIEIGLGQSMRLIANALELAKQDFCVIDLPLNIPVRRDDRTWEHKISTAPIYGINLLHITPQDLGMSYLSLGKHTLQNRYNIGFWLWELETLPVESQQALRLVDEIWTPSEFTSNCFRKITGKPVYTIPYHVVADTDPAYDRTYFGLPKEQFLYLVMFDFNSTMRRKNPTGAIEAFKQAFGPQEQDVGLVIKINNATEECIETLDAMLSDYHNVYYITKTLNKTETNSLIHCTDVFVSLHRAEGFGLIMAEAMLLKTACIATNWSSNTDFMNDDIACMVSYTKKQIATGEGSYPPGATWADPHVEEAATYMRKLKESPDFYQKIVENAYTHTIQTLGAERIAKMLNQRLAQINRSILEQASNP